MNHTLIRYEQNHAIASCYLHTVFHTAIVFIMIESPTLCAPLFGAIVKASRLTIHWTRVRNLQMQFHFFNLIHSPSFDVIRLLITHKKKQMQNSKFNKTSKGINVF